jgi:hypothetical protein
VAESGSRHVAAAGVLGHGDPWLPVRRHAAGDDAGDMRAVAALVDEGARLVPAAGTAVMRGDLGMDQIAEVLVQIVRPPVW